MKQIGFKNFRKFKELDKMILSPITIFVGENNAGKSTVVKGILALSDFLNDKRGIDDSVILNVDSQGENRIDVNKLLLKHIEFRFDTNYLAHIGTFKRALFNKAIDDTITFETNIGAMIISISVKGNRNDIVATSGQISKVHINLQLFNIDLFIDVLSDKATIIFNEKPLAGINLGTKVNELQSKYFSLFEKKISLNTEISSNWNPVRSNLIKSFIEIFENAITASYINIMKLGEDKGFIRYIRPGAPFKDMSAEDEAILKNIVQVFYPGDNLNRMDHFRFIPVTFSDRYAFSRVSDIEYLYAHAVNQSVLYSAKDTNDYLSLTIHEFAPHQKKKYKKDFVLKWMKEFGIGTDFRIESIGGEAHLVYITNSDGEIVNLADKGMGSIQLMILLFRLAIYIPEKRFRNILNLSEKVIIIEEPEQNLHPMLQSKLADLFYQINKEYNFRFIIETHSEYLIRKSQVIVSEHYNSSDKIALNPFKVYYFPSEGNPYEVIYRSNGRFENDFGKGFYDEAASLTFKLF